MKLVVFGLSISSSWGNGHATLWRALCDALQRRGHHVVFFERDVPYYRRHRDLDVLPAGRLVLYDDWTSVEPLAQRETTDADAVIVTSYCPDALAARDLACSADATAVFYDLDTGVTLARVARGETVEYIGDAGLGDYDVVLSYTGGVALARLHDELGARRVAPLHGSVDPRVHYPVPPAMRYRADLSYLATHSDDRHAQVLELIVRPATRMAQCRFLIAGPQYPRDFPWRTNIHYIEHVAPALHPQFYCSSRVTLNLTRAAMANSGYCPSGRMFEAAAAGAPILTDAWEGLDTFFTPDDEILVVRTADDVVAALSLSDAELQRLGAAARARTLEQHTADRRAQELEQLLAGAAAGDQPRAAALAEV